MTDKTNKEVIEEFQKINDSNEDRSKGFRKDLIRLFEKVEAIEKCFAVLKTDFKNVKGILTLIGGTVLVGLVGIAMKVIFGA